MGSVGINKPTPSVYSSILTEKGVKKAMKQIIALFEKY